MRQNILVNCKLKLCHYATLLAFIPESRYLSVRRYHPHAKQLRTHNKRLNINFHIEGDIAIVDKILASKMIIN